MPLPFVVTFKGVVSGPKAVVRFDDFVTLYWVFANVLATAQALWAYKMPAPPLEKVQTVKGGVVPKPGFMEKLQKMMEAQAEQQKSLGQKPTEEPPNGKPKNGKPENKVDPKYFGKTGTPKKGRKK